MVLQGEAVIKIWDRKQLPKIYKKVWGLSQSVSGITKCDRSVLQSKCVGCYKVWQAVIT